MRSRPGFIGFMQKRSNRSYHERTTGHRLFRALSDFVGDALHPRGDCRRAMAPRRSCGAGQTGVCERVGSRRHPDLADDLPDDAQSRFSEREKRRTTPERNSDHLRNELADKTLYDVRDRMAVLLRAVQVIHPRTAGRAVSVRGRSVRGRALYGDGVRMEPPHPGRCGLYAGAGRRERPDYPCGICAYRRASAGCGRSVDTVGYAVAVGRDVRRHPAGGRAS